MQLEDPRIRYKQLQNERCSTESIPLQPLHGSPYHVYPASNFPAVKAFQGPNPSLHNVSASPLLSSKTQLQMEMSPVLRPCSPQTPRMGNLPRRQTIQETSFTNQIDTDAVVAKINNMFPTASENHIRLLLKKYLKNIFPKADETLLLDILANSDNNVQKASEKLLAMGYSKREVTAPKLSNRGEEQRKVHQANVEKIIPLHPKVLSAEEKEEIKKTLQERYKDIAERIILMALESVNYSEDRASQILQIVLQEDENKAKHQVIEGETSKQEGTIIEEPQVTNERITPRGSTDDEPDTTNKTEFKSVIGRLTTKGPNSELCKGPNDELLLADYVTWNGANPDISVGRKGLANGSDPSLLADRNYGPRGHNNDLCKGPQVGLAKGSIYSQLNRSMTANVKCN